MTITPEPEPKPPARRGTSNKNQRGGSEDRRKRREWLVETYRANVDMLTGEDARRWWSETYIWSITHRGWVDRDDLNGTSLIVFESMPDFETTTTTFLVPNGQGTPCCRCYRCGDLLTVDTVTVDRIIPGCKGGTYRRNNIRPACGRCNSETGGSLASRPAKRKKKTPRKPRRDPEPPF